MIMVAEMTGNLGTLAPAMVAVAISTFIVSRADDSIYRSQLRNREGSPGARLQSALPGLDRVLVGDAAQAPRLVLGGATPVAQAITELRAAKVPGAPVVDANGLFLGTVDEASLSALDTHERAGPVSRAVDTTAPTISSGAGLGSALEVVAQTGGQWVTVTAQSRQVVGILAVSEIVTAYRAALDRSLGLLSRVTGNAVSVDEKVGPRSAVLGRPLRDAALPPGCIVVTVRRGDQVLFANASTVLAEGDFVTALATPATAEAMALLLCGDDRPAEARESRSPMV
jgi:CBS domain-containing protein